MSRLRVKLNKKPCINHETLNWSSYHTETIYRFSRDLDRDRHTRRWPQTGLHLGKNTSNCDTNEPFSSLVRYQLEITFVKAVEHLRIFAIFFGVAGVRAEREREGGGGGGGGEEKHPGMYIVKMGTTVTNSFTMAYRDQLWKCCESCFAERSSRGTLADIYRRVYTINCPRNRDRSRFIIMSSGRVTFA